MTFTYTPSSTPTDLTRVRFHTGQTVEGESFLTDEEIAMLIAEEGSWQKAAIAGIQFIIMRLSQPDFKADWLQVTNSQARAGYGSCWRRSARSSAWWRSRPAQCTCTGRTVWRRSRRLTTRNKQ